MLINFFLTLRKYKVPVTIRELMDLLEALRQRVVYSSIDDFYLLSRTCLVKDEKNYDKFDRAFSAYFKGLEDLHGMLEALIPDEWLRREFESGETEEAQGNPSRSDPRLHGVASVFPDVTMIRAA